MWHAVGAISCQAISGMPEGPSLVEPLGIIILAFLQKDSNSLLTSN